MRSLLRASGGVSRNLSACQSITKLKQPQPRKAALSPQGIIDEAFSPPPELRVGLSNSHWLAGDGGERSEEHTSNSSHVRISYAVFCLKKKKASMPPLTHLRDLVYK